MDKFLKLGAALIASYTDMVPAVAFTGLAARKRAFQGGTGSDRDRVHFTLPASRS